MRIHDYKKPESLEAAFELLQQPNASIIAGGGWLKLLPKEIQTAVDLSKLGLDQIEVSTEAVTIGAMVTLRQVETSEHVQSICSGILTQAISHIMGVTLRNIVTLGGSVAGKFGFSDLMAPLLVMEAKVELYPSGVIPLEAYLNHKNKDIITKIIIPITDAKGYYKTVKKTANDFPVINVAIAKGNAYKISVGARPAIAALCADAMTYINGKTVTEDVMDKTASLVASDMGFGTNSRADQSYRIHLAEILVGRGLREVTL